MERFFSKFELLTSLALLLSLALSASSEEYAASFLGSTGAGSGLSITQDSNRPLAVSYFNSRTASLAVSSFENSAWRTETLASNKTPEAATALVYHGTKLYLAYYDIAAAKLRILAKNAGTWSEVLARAADGSSAELRAVSCAGQLSVLYYDENSNSLSLLEGQETTWALEKTVVSGSARGRMHDLQCANNMRQIVYYDEARKVARLLREVAKGSWLEEDVPNARAASAAYPRLKTDSSSTIHLVSSRVSAVGGRGLGLYYARRAVDGSWAQAIVNESYAGGSASILLNANNRPVVTAAYNKPGAFGGIYQAELLANGLWREEVLGASGQGAARSYKASFVNGGVSSTGFHFFAYALEAEQANTLDPDQVIQLIAARSENFLIGGVSLGFPATEAAPSASVPVPNPVPSPEPRLNKDSDGDGLSDAEEAELGTDCQNADTDGDGVSDGQEVLDGTDPLDSGSVLMRLGTTVCAEWNGFLGGMWNVLEHVNMSASTLRIRTIMYDISGQAVDTYHFSVLPGAQRDLLIHGFSGRQLGSYGKVCSTHSGQSGDLDGRMVYYKQGQARDSSGFDFAFAMPFLNPKAGPQYVSYNTFQPSFNPADANNMVANWVQLTNMSEFAATGRLRFFDSMGQTIREEAVRLAAGARADFSAHSVGRDQVGLVQWLPDCGEAKFQLRIVRYLYDNPGGEDSFAAAFQLEGSKGSRSLQTAALDTTEGATSVIEVSNTLSREVRVKLNVYGEQGEVVDIINFSLLPYAVRHFIANDILGSDRLGTVALRGSEPESVMAVVMQYERDEIGGLASMSGTQAKESLGTVLRGSYNTFLAQESEVIIVNSSATTENVSLTLVRNIGERLIIPALENIRVPAHGQVVVSLSEHTGADDYGVVTLQASSTNTVSSWLKRSRVSEYSMPTPLRQ